MPSVLCHKVINEELFIHQLLVLSYHICKEKYYVKKTVKIQSVVQFIKSLVSRKYKIIWQQNAERKMLPSSLSLSLSVSGRKSGSHFTISNFDWKQMLVQARTGEKILRKILRAQPCLSGPWPAQPITAQHWLFLGVKQAFLLAWDSNVGVRSRCPGKVSESKPTQSKDKVKTFACSTGQWPKPVLIQLNMPSLSSSLSLSLCVFLCVCLSLSSVLRVKSFKLNVF